MDLFAILVADNVSRRGSGISAQDDSVLVDDADDGCSSLGGFRSLESVLHERLISAKIQNFNSISVAVVGYG